MISRTRSLCGIKNTLGSTDIISSPRFDSTLRQAQGRLRLCLSTEAGFPPMEMTRLKIGASMTNSAWSKLKGGFSWGTANQPSVASPTRFRRTVLGSNFGSTLMWRTSPVNYRIRSCRSTFSRWLMQVIQHRRLCPRKPKRI